MKKSGRGIAHVVKGSSVLLAVLGPLFLCTGSDAGPAAHPHLLAAGSSAGTA